MSTRTELRTSDATPDSLAAVQRKTCPTIVCPSTAAFEIRALTLDELAADEALPDDLLRVALVESHAPGGVSAEIAAAAGRDDVDEARRLSRALLELRDRIVHKAVVKPALTLAQVKKLDPYDKAMIVEFAQRQRSIDAAGREVGADTLDTFRRVCAFLARTEDRAPRKELLLELADLQ